MSEKAVLTRKQEELLLRYVDGECGLLERRRVESLLRRDETARRFMHALRRASESVCAAIEEETAGCRPDLWTRIAARITQEERSAAFLGARQAEREPLRRGMLWGMSGAAFAAAMITVALLHGGAPAASPGGLFAKDASPIPTVNLVSQQLAYQPPRMLEDDAAVEVDWLRSQGRVTMIPGPSRRSAIIWVNRNRPPLYRRQQPIRMMEENVPTAVPVSK